MYYLNKNQLLPSVVFFSTLILPFIIALIIAYAVEPKIEILLILLSLSLVYVVIILVMFCISRQKKWFILVEDESVQIRYLDNFKGDTKIRLKYEEIKQIEYYRINTIRGWTVLQSYVFPQSVFITFVYDGVEQKKFIGYLDKKAIQNFAEKNIQIKIH